MNFEGGSECIISDMHAQDLHCKLERSPGQLGNQKTAKDDCSLRGRFQAAYSLLDPVNVLIDRFSARRFAFRWAATSRALDLECGIPSVQMVEWEMEFFRKDYAIRMPQCT